MLGIGSNSSEYKPIKASIPKYMINGIKQNRILDWIARLFSIFPFRFGSITIILCGRHHFNGKTKFETLITNFVIISTNSHKLLIYQSVKLTITYFIGFRNASFSLNYRYYGAAP